MTDIQAAIFRTAEAEFMEGDGSSLIKEWQDPRRDYQESARHAPHAPAALAKTFSVTNDCYPRGVVPSWSGRAKPL